MTARGGLVLGLVVGGLLVGCLAGVILLQQARRHAALAREFPALSRRAGCAEYVMNRVHFTEAERAQWLTRAGRRQLFETCLMHEARRVE